jgi:hypothetical protein
MDEHWDDIIYDLLIKVEDDILATFLVWHEAYGYFKVTEEIDVDGIDDVAKYYKEELKNTTYNWLSKSEDEWESLYEAKKFEFVNLD